MYSQFKAKRKLYNQKTKDSCTSDTILLHIPILKNLVFTL